MQRLAISQDGQIIDTFQFPQNGLFDTIMGITSKQVHNVSNIGYHEAADRYSISGHFWDSTLDRFGRPSRRISGIVMHFKEDSFSHYEVNNHRPFGGTSLTEIGNFLLQNTHIGNGLYIRIFSELWTVPIPELRPHTDFSIELYHENIGYINTLESYRHLTNSDSAVLPITIINDQEQPGYFFYIYSVVDNQSGRQYYMEHKNIYNNVTYRTLLTENMIGKENQYPLPYYHAIDQTKNGDIITAWASHLYSRRLEEVNEIPPPIQADSANLYLNVYDRETGILKKSKTYDSEFLSQIDPFQRTNFLFVKGGTALSNGNFAVFGTQSNPDTKLREVFLCIFNTDLDFLHYRIIAPFELMPEERPDSRVYGDRYDNDPISLKETADSGLVLTGSVYASPGIMGSPPYNSTYQIKMDKYGCYSENCQLNDTTIQRLLSSRSITSEPLAATPIHIYPNPSNGNLTFQRAEAVSCQLQIYNMQGKILHSEEWRGLEKQLSVNWPAGIYSVVIQQADGAVMTDKIVIH